MKQLVFFLLLCCQQLSFGQAIDQKLETHQSAYQLEKIYISLNQPYYSPGDTIYGKVFLVNGRTHTFYEGTPIVYMDWITESGTIEQSHTLKIKNGVATISIPVEREYEEGRYLLRAYTQYQKNFDDAYIFQKEIKIIGEEALSAKEKIGDVTNFSIQFFPEGGHLVNGLTASLAFKVQDGKGKNAEATGVIFNKQNEEIAKIKTFNEGIGVTNFTPESGQKYTAKVKCNGLERTFDLPNVLKEGFVLTANSRKKDVIVLKMLASNGQSLSGCTMIGHLRGQIFLSQPLTDKPAEQLALAKAQIPSGLLHFTLFDAKQRPVCERLVFNNNPTEQVALSITVPKTEYSLKELVKAEISNTSEADLKGAEMTVTVYNNDLFKSANNGVNIKNYLLLQSDLKGRINNINQYFEKDDAKSRTLLDYLLLTHGWRRFNWIEVLEDKTQSIIYPTEESISFAGSVKKDNNRDVAVKADVFLSNLDPANFTSVNVTTEEDGLFFFKGFDFPDSTEILIQANIYNAKKKGKLKKGEAKRTGNKNVKIELLNLHELAYNDSITLKDIPFNKKEQLEFATEVNRIRKVDTIYHPEWTIDLDAVTVRGSRIDERRKQERELRNKYKERGLFYSESSQKILLDDVALKDVYLDIFELIAARVPGARVSTLSPGEKQVLLRGENSITGTSYALIEVDGVVVSAASAAQIQPNLVELIDVKKGLFATSVYGEAGNGGVISILTREPGSETRKIYTPGILNIQHNGYHKARTFYAPNYADPMVDKTKPDYRTGLYWNPSLIAKNGKANLEFYTGDKFAEFLILVEGITANGVPFIGKQLLKVGQE